MAVSVEQFRAAHERLRAWVPELGRAARALPELTAAERECVRDDLLGELAPLERHMHLDERLLFPEVAHRLHDPFATASMAYDHLAIRDWIRRLQGASLSDTAELQELLYGLDALIRVHLWKEDALYLAMLDDPSWPETAATPFQ